MSRLFLTTTELEGYCWQVSNFQVALGKNVTFLIIDDAIRNGAVVYDLIINDERLLEEAYINGDNPPSNTDGEGSNNEDEDDDNN